MKKPFQLLGLLALAVPTAAHSATTIYSDDFETTTFKNAAYVNITDDEKWIRAGGDSFGLARTDRLPDDTFSSGSEMRVGYDPEPYGSGNPTADLTLTTTWDASQAYTASFSYRSFDGRGTPAAGGGMNGQIVFGYRDSAGLINFFGANLVLSSLSSEGWATASLEVTPDQLAAADGNRILVRFQKSGNGGGLRPDGMYIDNLLITAVPEPSTALLGSLGALALLRRRRA